MISVKSNKKDGEIFTFTPAEHPPGTVFVDGYPIEPGQSIEVNGTIIENKIDDRLPSGEPCREDEVAGLGAVNLGPQDPFRKPAVLHDRLYDGIIAGTSDISQDQADRYFLRAMLAEAPRHQLGYLRTYVRYGIVRLVSFFRRVGK